MCEKDALVLISPVFNESLIVFRIIRKMSFTERKTKCSLFSLEESLGHIHAQRTPFLCLAQRASSRDVAVMVRGAEGQGALPAGLQSLSGSHSKVLRH